MKTKEEIVKFCLTYPEVYKDYPFEDTGWCVIRHRDKKKKGFAWIFERNGEIWVNMKCDPGWKEVLRDAYPAVLPAYHMNKTHWNSVILNGSVPADVLTDMLDMSYELTKA